MTKTLRLILGDQLNSNHSWYKTIDDSVTYVMMEIRTETDYASHHIQKVVGFFAAMQSFYNELISKKHSVIYISINDEDNLQSFDKNILDLEILTTPKATLYIKHQELGFAPLYVFGDGFKLTLAIALNLLTIADGVLLVDEIETSIHVSALSRIFSWLIEACHRLNIQLFVTTHSLEAIDAMLKPEIAIEDVVAFRLNAKGQAPQRFSGDLLHRLRSERGLDVR